MDKANGVVEGTAKKSNLRVVGRKSNRRQACLPQSVTIKVDSDAVSCDSGDVSPFETSPVRSLAKKTQNMQMMITRS